MPVAALIRLLGALGVGVYGAADHPWMQQSRRRSATHIAALWLLPPRSNRRRPSGPSELIVRESTATLDAACTVLVTSDGLSEGAARRPLSIAKSAQRCGRRAVIFLGVGLGCRTVVVPMKTWAAACHAGTSTPSSSLVQNSTPLVPPPASAGSTPWSAYRCRRRCQRVA